MAIIVNTLITELYFQEEERKVATQLKTTVMPIKQPGVKSRARKVTAEEKKFSAFATLRKVNYFMIISLNLNVTNFIFLLICSNE
jgi:hypothetical protein